MTKTELRREMRRRLGPFAAQGAEASRAIAAAIASYAGWNRIKVVALYSALPGEPDLAALWKEGAPAFCYPRIEDGRMIFCEVRSPSELAISLWHPKILEPVFCAERVVPAERIDLMLVPGLAFTRDGQRLGRGGGFYDRYLASLPETTVKLGVCFECQIVAELPLEAHDQRVDGVVTENGISGVSAFNA